MAECGVKIGPFLYEPAPGEIVSPARWYGCPSYDDCLRKADLEGWRSFSCKSKEERCDLMPMRGSQFKRSAEIVFEHEIFTDDLLSKE